MRESSKKIEKLLSDSRRAAIHLLNDTNHQSSAINDKSISNVITKLEDKETLKNELINYRHFDNISAYYTVEKKLKRIRYRRTLKAGLAIASCIAALVFTIYQINSSRNQFEELQTESIISRTQQQNIIIPTHKLKAVIIDDKGVSKDIDAQTTNVKMGDITIQNDPVNSLLSYQNTNSTTSKINQLQIPKGSNYQLVLHDGTVVTLNSDSYLKYPTSFNGNTREVELIGEALFDVAHNTKLPFHVKTQHGTIQVFGTVFNVKSYKEEQTTEVTLVAGSVAFGNRHNVVKIKPGEQAFATSSESYVDVRKIDVSHCISWTKNMFDYENTPLYIVINDINRSYNTQINIASLELRNVEVTFKLSKDKTLEDVIETLEKSDIIKLKKIGKEYMLIKGN